MIGVVLPVYNGAAYLEQSLDSVLAQQGVDFECIVWDDGSTDQSSNILKHYQDSRLKLYQNRENCGLFPTLNASIRLAPGDLIRLWSQDDIMKPGCLSAEEQFHLEHPEIAMSYCARDIIDARGKVTLPAPNDATPDVISPQLATQIMFYHGSITGNIANVMLKRSTLERVGLFDESLRVAADFEMWVRITARAPIGFLRQSLMYLRSHSEQFSRRKGINIAFMQECRPIYQTLLSRMPIEIQSYARQYYRRHHLLLHVHYMMRCLLAGDIELFRKSWEEIAQSENPMWLLPLWVVSLDHRVFRPKPKYVLY